MKKSLFLIFAFLICAMSFTACKKDDKKVNVVKHPTELTVKEVDQDYEAQGNYYIATNKTGEALKRLFLNATLKDKVTGEIIEAPDIEWYGYDGLIGKGKFEPNEGSTFTVYTPVLDSTPTVVYAVAAYRGNAKYNPSDVDIRIKQNY